MKVQIVLESSYPLDDDNITVFALFDIEDIDEETKENVLGGFQTEIEDDAADLEGTTLDCTGCLLEEGYWQEGFHCPDMYPNDREESEKLLTPYVNELRRRFIKEGVKCSEVRFEEEEI